LEEEGRRFKGIWLLISVYVFVGVDPCVYPEEVTKDTERFRQDRHDWQDYHGMHGNSGIHRKIFRF
jgi:hypothetical protein